jgi:uncharacterized membrane protein
MKPRTLAILRWAATVLFVVAGANHFINPAPYLGMMPAEIPVTWHSPLNIISGAAEILGGLGLILPATRRLAAWGLIALLVAVFPANVNMAINELPLGTKAVPTWMLWARLPLQAVAIAWVYLFTRRAAQ